MVVPPCQLKTGDLLLCRAGNKESWPTSWFANLIKFFTQSPYSHAAMIVDTPRFTDVALEAGLYVWESSGGDPTVTDPQDGLHKFGVRLTPLAEFLEEYKAQAGTVWVRTLDSGRERLTKDVLLSVHRTVYAKPYDVRPDDWLKALFPHALSSIAPQSTDRFWCSSLVGYVYVAAGLLKPSTVWSLLSPADFAGATQTVSLTEGTVLGEDKQIL